MMGKYQISATQHIPRHCNLFPKGNTILYRYLLFTFNTKSMIATLLLKYGWVKINNENFIVFLITGYDYFIRLCKDGILEPKNNSPTLSFKSYYPVDNFKRSIKRDPTTTGFYMVTTFCDSTKNILSVTPDFFCHPRPRHYEQRGSGDKGGTWNIHILPRIWP